MAFCSQCGKQTRDGDSFCMDCGKPVAASKQPEPVESVAIDDNNIIASWTRFGSLGSLFGRSVRVSEGQKAMLLIDGRVDSELDPGVHSLSFGQARRAEVLVTKSGDIQLGLRLSGALSSDDLPVEADAQPVVQIVDARNLMVNLMANAEELSTADMSAALALEIGESFKSFMRGQTIKDAGISDHLKKDFEYELLNHLKTTFDRWGLRLVFLRSLNITSPGLDMARDVRVNAAERTVVQEAQLDGRKGAFEAERRESEQNIVEQESDVSLFERRSEVWERMRTAAVDEDMSKIRSEEDMRDFMRNLDKDRLLKDDDYERFVRTLRDAKEDASLFRNFVVSRTVSEQAHESKMLEIQRAGSVSEAEMEMRQRKERQQIEAKLEIDRRTIEEALFRQGLTAGFRREQSTLDADSRRDNELKDAGTNSAISEIEQKTEADELKMAMSAYEDYRRIKRENIAGLNEIERIDRIGNAEIEDKKKSAEHKRELEKNEQEHRQHLEKVEVYSRANPAALIAVVDMPHAEILASMAKTETMKGMSAEQILATQAENSPQAAEAVKEIMIAVSKNGEFEQMERLLSEMKRNAETSREDYQRNVVTLQEMFNKAMDSMTDTATAFANQPRPQQPPQQ